MPSAILEHSLSLVGLYLELTAAPSTARRPRLLRFMCRQARITAVRCRALAATDARHSPGVLYAAQSTLLRRLGPPADALISLDLIPFALVRKNSTALRDCNCLCSTGSIQLAEYRFDVGFDGSLCQCQFHRDPLITQSQHHQSQDRLFSCSQRLLVHLLRNPARDQRPYCHTTVMHGANAIH